jgi:hypothetical protein
MDYNIAVNSSFLINLSKGGKQRYSITAPEDVSFMKCLEINGIPFLFGEKNTHPDNTLIPFIAEIDSSSLSWAYTDSTVVGLTHIRDIVVHANSIFFLGDDNSNETGTISIFKYDLIPLEKTQTIKRTTKKNK